MAPDTAALTLNVSPQSVRDARRWVVEACRGIGREDLADCAELAVSELVTNSLLHGLPPIVVRLGGTVAHPRIEVSDGSPDPPSLNPRMAEDDELLSTIGRGLGLVASCSTVWGARILAEGKVVWFVPSTMQLSERIHRPGRIQYEGEPPDTDPAPKEPATIRILGLPTATYTAFRQHYREIRRELSLLALASEETYPTAATLSELFLLFEHDFRLNSGSSAVERALATGGDVVDVDIIVERSSIPTIAQMIDVLELANEFCRTERLLSVAASPALREFSRWYLGEFVRQGRRLPPTPGPGATRGAQP